MLHLLQHTAGFDDMHFNELYNMTDPPDLPLLRGAGAQPASRRVRWRPGTRMSYSNPGYAVAAAVLEQVTGKPYEDVIRDRIFAPLGMRTSSFVLSDQDDALLARGYDSPAGPPVPFSQIYLRPAGNLHTSAAELGRFVQMLLNWGETSDQLVIDPEYLSNMERPRTSLSSRAGLIYGYGYGHRLTIAGGLPRARSRRRNRRLRLDLRLLRRAGCRLGGARQRLVRLAGGGAALRTGARLPQARRGAAGEARVATSRPRCSPPTRATTSPKGSRNEVFGAIEWLTGGTTIRPEANGLVAQPVLGQSQRLVPTSDNLFRRADDVTPSRVFTTDDESRDVMLGDGLYGVRTARWQVEVIRVPVLLSVAVLATVPVVFLLWLVRIRAARPAGFWALKLALLVLPFALTALCSLPLWVPGREWGVPNLWTRLTFIGSCALPLFSIVAVVLVVDAWRRDAGPWLRRYAVAVTLAGLAMSAFTAVWGLVGLRPWVY